MIHELKIITEEYKEVLLELKKVQLRKNDRNYQVGDILYLNEYDSQNKKYTGSQVIRKVDYILGNDLNNIAAQNLLKVCPFVAPKIASKGLNPGYVLLQISKPL